MTDPHATAHKIATKAIRQGRLVRQPCIICGDPESDGHHEDYSKPLEVIWLCRGHHIRLHRNGSPFWAVAPQWIRARLRDGRPVFPGHRKAAA